MTDYAFDDGDERCFRCGEDISMCECTEDEITAYCDGLYDAFCADERRRRDEAAYFAQFYVTDEEG